MKTHAVARRKAKQRQVCNVNIFVNRTNKTSVTNDGAGDDGVELEARPEPSHQQESEMRNERYQHSTPEHHKKIFKQVENVSKKKLLNSYFMQMSLIKKRCLTRNKAAKIGLLMSKKAEKATGNCIMSLENLGHSIQNFAICSNVKVQEVAFHYWRLNKKEKG